MIVYARSLSRNLFRPFALCSISTINNGSLPGARHAAMASGSKSAPAAFASLQPSLHPLLLRSLASLQFPSPTPIQSTLIPLALSSSRDILARARTGSGKTLAYAIPILQGILTRRDTAANASGINEAKTRALILVPTRELAEQVRGQVTKLVEGLGIGESDQAAIRVVNVAGNDAAKRKKKNSNLGGERVERYAIPLASFHRASCADTITLLRIGCNLLIVQRLS